MASVKTSKEMRKRFEETRRTEREYYEAERKRMEASGEYAPPVPIHDSVLEIYGEMVKARIKIAELAIKAKEAEERLDAAREKADKVHKVWSMRLCDAHDLPRDAEWTVLGGEGCDPVLFVNKQPSKPEWERNPALKSLIDGLRATGAGVLGGRFGEDGEVEVTGVDEMPLHIREALLRALTAQKEKDDRTLQ